MYRLLLLSSKIDPFRSKKQQMLLVAKCRVFFGSLIWMSHLLCRQLYSNNGCRILHHLCISKRARPILQRAFKMRAIHTEIRRFWLMARLLEKILCSVPRTQKNTWPFFKRKIRELIILLCLQVSDIEYVDKYDQHCETVYEWGVFPTKQISWNIRNCFSTLHRKSCGTKYRQSCEPYYEDVCKNHKVRNGKKIQKSSWVKNVTTFFIFFKKIRPQ